MLVAKKILVVTADGQKEFFEGNDIRSEIYKDFLRVCDGEQVLGFFKYWQYTRVWRR